MFDKGMLDEEEMFDKNLPQLRIAGPKCSLVRENEINEGKWFLSYLGGEFDDFYDNNLHVTVEAFRMKAVDWIVSPPVVSTDPSSPCYKATVKRSDKKDEQCLWGPEYLLTIEDEVSALLYLGNKSSRSLMSTIRVGGTYILSPQKRTHGEFTWYVPNVSPLEVPDACLQSDS